MLTEIYMRSQMLVLRAADWVRLRFLMRTFQAASLKQTN